MVDRLHYQFRMNSDEITAHPALSKAFTTFRGLRLWIPAIYEEALVAVFLSAKTSRCP
jgi:hypothetical protein